MRVFDLKNYGVLEDRLPKKLHNDLLSEIDYAELKNPDMLSGLTNKNVAKHKFLVDTKDDLLNYIKTLLVTYNSNFPGLSNLNVLTKDLPYHMGNPWINYQRKCEYVPNHTHDGIYSYSIWLKIPAKCNFEFTYTNIIGNIEQQKIELTQENEGKIIFFPAKLPHIAYPFSDSDGVRVSISGNISLDSNDKIN